VKKAVQRDDNAVLERLFVRLVLFPEADEEVTAALSFGNRLVPAAAPSLWRYQGCIQAEALWAQETAEETAGFLFLKLLCC
jgi:hypothetical protein